MEYLKELKEIYKDVHINKNNRDNSKGIQTEEDLIIVLKSTQLLKDKRKEIIELWREDPIYKLEQKYGKEVVQKVFQRKKEKMCEEQFNQIFNKLSNDEKLKLLEENLII